MVPWQHYYNVVPPFASLRRPPISSFILIFKPSQLSLWSTINQFILTPTANTPITISYASTIPPQQQRQRAKQREHKKHHPAKRTLLGALDVVNSANEKWLSGEENVDEEEEEGAGEGVEAEDFGGAHYDVVFALDLHHGDIISILTEHWTLCWRTFWDGIFLWRSQVTR